jgi:hypothetical protein
MDAMANATHATLLKSSPGGLALGSSLYFTDLAGLHLEQSRFLWP